MQEFIQPRHSLKDFKERRRELRKNQTPQESKLWYQLRKKTLGVRFRRQHSIGGYIADFYCTTHKLIIEIDGSVHDTEEAQKYDEVRSQYFREFGYKILRFSNTEVDKNIEVVLEKIKTNLT